MSETSNRELHERIWFGKAGSGGQLTAEEAALLSNDPQARRLLALSAALCSCAQEPAPWPAPEREALLAAAVEGATAITGSGRRGRAALDPHGVVPGIRRRPWYGYAIAAAVLLLGVWGVVQALRLAGVDGLRFPAGDTLRQAVAPAGVAWAEVDGYVLEYQLSFGDYFSGTAADPPDHPVWLMNNAVEQWAAENGVVFLTDGDGPRVQFELDRYRRGVLENEKSYAAILRIRLLGVGEELKNDLRHRLATIDGTPDPEEFSETLYYSEKYPASYYPGRKLVINGTTYVYPTDFTGEEADSLQSFLRISPTEQGESYNAYYRIGDGSRIPLADVIHVRYGETIYIDDYAEHFDRSQLRMLSFEKAAMLYVPPAEVNVDFDPLEALARNAGHRDNGYYGAWNMTNRRGYRFVVDLLPPDTWPGEDGAAAADRSEAIADAMDRAAGLQAAVERWTKNYPELAADGEYSHLLDPGVVPVGGVPVQWQVALWISHDEPRQQLAEAISQAGAKYREWAMRPSPEDLARYPMTNHQNQETREYWALYYTLLDMRDEHGYDWKGVLERLSPGEKQASVDLRDKMQQAFDRWLKEVREGQPQFEAEFSGTEIDGVVAHASVILYRDDEELVDSLCEALAKTGAPEPQRSFNHGGEPQPVGIGIQARLFDYRRFIGVDSEDAADVVTPVEVEWAEELAARFADAAENWKREAGLEYHVEQQFGGVTVALVAGTNQSPGPALDELTEYFTQQVGCKFETFVPWSYNAGGDVDSAEVPEVGFGQGDTRLQILSYHLQPDRAYYLADSVEDIGALWSADDRSRIESTVAAMQEALEQWNAENPPNRELGETEASLEFEKRSGLPITVAVKCNRMNEETMHSIARALEDTGAPTYQYGTGYSNRHVYSQRAVDQPSKGCHWTYMIVPQVLWVGSDLKQLAAEFSDEEKQESRERELAIREVFADWLERHPEFGEPDWKADNFHMNPYSQYHTLTIEDLVLSVGIELWLDDDDRRNDMAADLQQHILDETGEELAGRMMNSHRNSRIVP